MTKIAWLFHMTDEAWRRHANPWSVWTRFAAIPVMIAAIWSRVWIGWWALLPVVAVIVWLLINPHVFSPVGPETWCARGIYGEKLWLEGREGIPAGYGRMFRFLILPAAAGFVLLGVGLVQLALWPTFSGAVLIVLTQLWRIDRLGRFYDEMRAS
jgi:hypothetical protein